MNRLFIKTSLSCLLSWAIGLVSVKAKPCRFTRQECKTYMSDQEKEKGIEPGILEAIAHIESGLSCLSVNVEGKSYRFKTPEEAADFVKEQQKKGRRNISVGLMQLHVPSHLRNFQSLEAMMHPYQNICYAAKMLSRFRKQTGSIEQAIKLYHSATPEKNERYKNQVFGAWARIYPRGSKRACP